MPAVVRNPTSSYLTLSYPLQGVLGPGQALCVDYTVAQLQAFMPPQNGALELIEVSPTYAGPFDSERTIINAYIDAKYYGLVADANYLNGSGTDNGHRLRVAIADVMASRTNGQGKELHIHFPPGFYLVTSVVNDVAMLLGLSPSNYYSRIKLIGHNTFFVMDIPTTAALFQLGAWHGPVIEDINFIGVANQGADCGWAIYTQACFHAVIRRCRFLNHRAQDSTVAFTAGGSGYVEDCEIEGSGGVNAAVTWDGVARGGTRRVLTNDIGVVNGVSTGSKIGASGIFPAAWFDVKGDQSGVIAAWDYTFEDCELDENAIRAVRARASVGSIGHLKLSNVRASLCSVSGANTIPGFDLNNIDYLEVIGGHGTQLGAGTARPGMGLAHINLARLDRFNLPDVNTQNARGITAASTVGSLEVRNMEPGTHYSSITADAAVNLSVIPKPGLPRYDNTTRPAAADVRAFQIENTQAQEIQQSNGSAWITLASTV